MHIPATAESTPSDGERLHLRIPLFHFDYARGCKSAFVIYVWNYNTENVIDKNQPYFEKKHFFSAARVFCFRSFAWAGRNGDFGAALPTDEISFTGIGVAG